MGNRTPAKKAARRRRAAASARGKAKPRGGLRYDAVTRAAIVKAALAARRAGRTWPKALEAAKRAGFRAKVPRLIRFVQSALKAAKKAVRIAAPKPPARKAAAPATPAGDLKALESTLGRIVQERVRTALDEAIAALQRARDQA